MRYPVLLLTLLLSGLAVAATPSDRPPELKPVPDGAPGPDDAPAVTIKPSSPGRVVEYRANGRLYMLKVIPSTASRITWSTRKATASLRRQESLDSGMRPPMWVIKEF